MVRQGRTGAVTILSPGFTDESSEANTTGEEFGGQVFLCLCSALPSWQLSG